MEAVGIGDLHFDGHSANHVEDHYTFIANELRKPLEYASVKGIGHAFLYGDVAHKPRMTYEAHHALLSVIDEYAHLHFHIILGNHDMNGVDAASGHSLELLIKAKRKNVTVYTQPTLLKVDGALVNFLPFPHSKFHSKALNVAHVDVQGAKNDNGREVDSKLQSDAVAVVGHIHTAQRVRNTYYSGTLYQTRFGESTEKFFHHINFKNPDRYSIELVPTTPDVALITQVVNSPADLDFDPEPGHLYRLIIKDGADVSPADWDHLNVLQHNSFKTTQDLQSILEVAHAEGEQIHISVPEFLEAYFAAKGTEAGRVSKLIKLRNSLLCNQEGVVV